MHGSATFEFGCRLLAPRSQSERRRAGLPRSLYGEAKNPTQRHTQQSNTSPRTSQARPGHHKREGNASSLPSSTSLLGKRLRGCRLWLFFQGRGTSLVASTAKSCAKSFHASASVSVATESQSVSNRRRTNGSIFRSQRQVKICCGRPNPPRKIRRWWRHWGPRHFAILTAHRCGGNRPT